MPLLLSQGGTNLVPSSSLWHHLRENGTKILRFSLSKPGFDWKRKIPKAANSLTFGIFPVLAGQFYGGGGGNRTRVRKCSTQSVYRFRLSLKSRRACCPQPGHVWPVCSIYSAAREQTTPPRGPIKFTTKLIRLPPHGATALIKQPLRKRNCRLWQLLVCRFLRGQRRLDLLLWLLHPRRNQGAPKTFCYAFY